MAPTIVLSGGGIKTAVAAACLGKDQPLVFVHVTYGQRAAEAEREATQRIAEFFPQSRSLAVTMDYPVQFQQQLGFDAGAQQAAARGVVGTHVLAGVGLKGTWAGLLWVGVQCALRTGGRRVVTGLSRLVDASHLGLGSVDGRPTRVPELVYAMSMAASTFLPEAQPFGIDMPMLDRSYAEIVKLAAHIEVPIEHAWSCSGVAPPRGRKRAGCGNCQTCHARTAAFLEARIPDPMADPVPAA